MGLKLNVLVFAGSAGLLCGFVLTGKMMLLGFMALALAFNLYINRGLLLAYHRAEGLGFALAATLYYLLLYPLAVGAGAAAGILRHWFSSPARPQEIP